jgi:hypothetical protein
MASRFPKSNPYQDDFEYFASLQEGSTTTYDIKIPDASWVRYPAHTDQTTDLDATKSLVTSKLPGILMGPTLQLEIASTVNATYNSIIGTKITFTSSLSGDYGYIIGEFLMVEFMNNLTGGGPFPTVHSARYQAVWLSNTEIWLPVSGWSMTGGTMNIPMHLLGRNQLLEAVFMGKSEGVGSDLTFLLRLDPDFTAIRHGYGIDIGFASGGSRTLSLFKYNYGSATTQLVTSKSITLMEANGSDLEVMQHIRVEVFDRPGGDVGVSDADSTIIRIFLNDTSGNDTPILEYEDKGGVLNSLPDTGMLPYSPGTFGVYFASAGTIYLDAIEVTDDFEPSRISGGYKLGRTFDELKTAVKWKAFGGSSTNYPDELIEQAINYSLSEVLTAVGSSSYFLHKTESITPTTVGTDVYKFPNRVAEIVSIRKEDRTVFSWNLQTRDSDTGELVLRVDGAQPPYDVTYIYARGELLHPEDRCPIPRDKDEAVVAGAALRIVGESDGDRRRYQVLASRYTIALRQLLTAMNKMQRGTKARAHVPISHGRLTDRYIQRKDQYWNF